MRRDTTSKKIHVPPILTFLVLLGLGSCTAETAIARAIIVALYEYVILDR